MSDQRIELGYNVTVTGTPELQNLNAAQRAVKQSTAETNSLFEESDKASRKAGAGIDALAAKQERLRRAAFKRGETYDPELIEEARIKTVAQAHRELDAQIEKAQLRQLNGLERLNAERKKSVNELRQLNDPALLEKANQLFRERAAGAKPTNPITLGGGGGGSGLNLRQIAAAGNNPQSGLTAIASGTAGELGLAAASAAALVVALLAAGAAAYTITHEAADFAQQTTNASIKLGLSTTEMLNLAGAAKIAGVNVESLTGAGRLLAAALEEPTTAGKKAVAALGQIGVSRFGENGQNKEEGRLIVDTLEGLSKIETTSKRIDLARQLLPRGLANAFLPYIADLDSLNEKIKNLHYELDGPLIDGLNKDAQKFNELGLAYDHLKTKLGGAIAPIIIPIVERFTQLFEGAPVDKKEQRARFALAGGILTGGLSLLATGTPNSIRNGPDHPGDRDTELGEVGKGHVAPPSDRERARRQSEVDRDSAAFDNTKEGLEAKKREAEEDLKKRNDKIGDVNFTGDVSAERKGRNADQSQIRSIEARLKELAKQEGEAEKLKTELEALQKKTNEFDQSGLEKINAEQAEYNRHVQESHRPLAEKNKLIAEGAEAFNKQRAAEEGKNTAQRIREGLGGEQKLAAARFGPGHELDSINTQFQVARANADLAFASDANSSKRDEALNKARIKQEEELLSLLERETAARREQRAALQEIKDEERTALAERKLSFNLTGVFVESDEETRARGQSGLRRQDIDTRRNNAVSSGKLSGPAADRQRELDIAKEDERLELDLLNVRQQGERQILQIKLQQIRTGTDQRSRLAELENPDNQQAVAQRVFEIRQEGIQAEYDRTKDLVKFKEDSDNLEFERVTKLLDLRNAETEKFKQTASEAILSLQNGGSQGFANFFSGLAKSIEGKVIGNAAGVGFGLIRDKLPQIGGQQQLDENGKPIKDANGVTQLTTLGKLLQGTPFATRSTDPAKLATDLNSEQTRLNTLATQALTTAMQASKAGVGVPGAKIPGFGSGSGSGGGTGADDSFPAGVDDGGNTPEENGNGGADDQLPLPGENSPQIPNVQLANNASSIASIVKVAGAAGAIAGGVFGVANGIKEGGARGAVSAVGSGLGAAAGIAALIPGGQVVAGALALGALTANLVKGLLGDPKKQRETAIDKELQANKYVQPQGISVNEDTSGRETQRDFKGNLRVLANAPKAVLYNQITGYDQFHTDRLLSTSQRQLDESGNAPPPPTSRDLTPSAFSTQAAPAQTIVHFSASIPVTAFDSKSVVDHSGAIADAVRKAFQDGHPLRFDIGRIAKPV